MKYAKKFKTKNEYNSYIGNPNVILPNVSYIEETEDAKFNEVIKDEAYVSMTTHSTQIVATPAGKSFEYSYDRNTWLPVTANLMFGEEGQETVYLRGKNPDGVGYGFVFYEINAKVDIGGNAMALIDWEAPPLIVPARAFRYTFAECSAIRTVSKDFLPATTLGEGCYDGMFALCSSLISAPNIPNAALSKNCCRFMFSECTSLLEAPALQSTRLTTGCYNQMFNKCSSLKKVPSLPAAVLENSCYVAMFTYCNSLNEIHCDATDISATDCTEAWLSGVASTGHFYGKSAANWPDGENGIPGGWTKHLS